MRGFLPLADTIILQINASRKRSAGSPFLSGLEPGESVPDGAPVLLRSAWPVDNAEMRDRTLRHEHFFTRELSDRARSRQQATVERQHRGCVNPAAS